jgi:hypothetical protein
MKTIIISALVLVAVGAAAFVVMPSKKESAALPQNKNTPIEFLKEIGFGNASGIKEETVKQDREFWMKRYGVNIIPGSDMSAYLSDNGFVMAPSSRYIGDIPEFAAKQMQMNYENISSLIPVATIRPAGGDGIQLLKEDLLPNWKFTWEYIRDVLTEDAINKHLLNRDDMWLLEPIPSSDLIKVLAPASKFDLAGMVVNDNVATIPNPDPVVVVAVHPNWIILAQW